ncbi:MAG: hypothetical protein CEO22_526, partial [Candidatus Berkelbacteria bacterium Gr01-1014_85]
YWPVIGLEIHAELNTERKMFCDCLNQPFELAANQAVCEVCYGLPGALPRLNPQAIEWAMRVGLALGATPALVTKWDRKNYFYPDLPKGYQISQYDRPLFTGGQLEVPLPTNPVVALTRLHLEEDTATLKHGNDRTALVNFNRSGVPLLELVTEPVIESGAVARSFAEEYQRLLRALGVSQADMEKGELRIEANISVRTSQQLAAGQFGTKVEVKNLNSFRSVERAIEFELERQSAMLAAGQPVIAETRGFSEASQATFSQRQKETAADYRYFPEPDLPALEFSDQWIESLRATLPALPSANRANLTSFGLNESQLQAVLNQPTKVSLLLDNLPETAEAARPTLIKLIINQPEFTHLEPVVMRRLAELLSQSAFSLNDLKTQLPLLVEAKLTTLAALEVKLEELGLNSTGGQADQQAQSQAVIECLTEIIARSEPQVLAYKQGKTALLGYFVGQAMAQLGRGYDPALVSQEARNLLQ